MTAPVPGTPPPWVVLDHGEVIGLQTDVRPDLAMLLGVPLGEFCAAYAACRTGYDRGWPDRYYWRAVGRRLGIRVSDEQITALTTLDIRGRDPARRPGPAHRPGSRRTCRWRCCRTPRAPTAGPSGDSRERHPSATCCSRVTWRAHGRPG